MAQRITFAFARARAHTHTFAHTSQKQEWDTWLGTEMSSGREPPREATVGSSYVYNVTGIAEPYRSSTHRQRYRGTHIRTQTRAHTAHTRTHTSCHLGRVSELHCAPSSFSLSLPPPIPYPFSFHVLCTSLTFDRDAVNKAAETASVVRQERVQTVREKNSGTQLLGRHL